MRNIQRRLKKLEAHRAPRGPLRLLVRYEGCEGLDAEEPQQDIDESDPNTVVLTVQYIDMPPKSPLGPTR
jgi:hypothetical protein